MSVSTIIRLRRVYLRHGIPTAVAAMRAIRPNSTPADFILFILGKTCRVR